MHRAGSIVRPALVIAAVVVCGTASVAAHDFWIEPGTFRTSPGSLIGVHLLVGENLLGDPIPRDAASIERFSVTRGGREQTVPGREGGDPAGALRVDGSGLLVVAYQSRPHPVSLSPATFEKYLGEEGLDAITAILPARGTRPREYRERYSRCAKALIASGPQTAADKDRAIGMPLELVAQENPYTIATGAELPIALLFQGKPHAGALVIAINREEPRSRLSARTDQHGRVRFAFPRGGGWMVKAVHMTAAPAGSDADWESRWASLTFEIPSEPKG
jgi:uncharacterized GH25 family protein